MLFTFAFNGSHSPLAQACLPLLRLACTHTHASTALVLEKAPHQAHVVAFSGQPLADTPAQHPGQWPETARHLVDRQAIARQLGMDPPDSVQALSLLPLAAGKALLCLFHERAQTPDGSDQATLSDIVSSLDTLLTITWEQQALMRREQRMALAIDGSNTGIWDRDLNKDRIHYSPRWKALIGYAEHEIGDDIHDSYKRIHPDDLARVQATIIDHLEQRTEAYEVEHRIRHRDGHYLWVRSRGKVVERDRSGKALRMVGTTTDISALRNMAEQLEQTAELMSALSNEIPGMVFQFHAQADGSGQFTYISAGSQEIYGVSPAELQANPQRLRQLLHPDDLGLYMGSLESATRNLTPWRLEYRVCRSDGSHTWCQGAARPTPQDDGSVLWHGFITDITERKNFEVELNVLATTDSLTQLSNRRHFIRQLDAELARLRRSIIRNATLLMFDLDHFKVINDSWGHSVGDQALRHFADVIRAHLRKTDAAGRIGGEEFAVVLCDADLDAALRFAERIQQELARTPLQHGDQQTHLATSVGVATLSNDDQAAEAALSRSDMALYRAKRAGRNRIEHQ